MLILYFADWFNVISVMIRYKNHSDKTKVHSGIVAARFF